jgi:hypothetical protein
VKISTQELRRIIKENVEKLLEEKKKEPQLREASLDAQIDRYLIDYEKEAKSLKQEGFDFRFMTRSFLNSMLNEEEEKEEDKEEEPKETETLTIEDIDIETFTSSVVRLIDNYDSLLEVRETIARRAGNYLLKNYDKSVVDEFKLILEEQHDVFLDEPEPIDDAEEFQAPAADRAGSSPSGGA